MDVFEAIQKRITVRAYQDKPVPEEKLSKILEAARLAPSSRNRQDYQLIVVRDQKMIKEIAAGVTHPKNFRTAPVVIVAVALNPKYIMPGGTPAYPIDIAIAFEHITLVAVKEKLGSCFAGGFKPKKIKEVLAIPDKYRVVLLLSLGYPNNIPDRKSKKPLQEILSYDRFLEQGNSSEKEADTKE